MTKLETALRIIAGTTMARSHWALFFGEDEIPEYKKGIASVEVYHSYVNVLVRNQACQWLAERLQFNSVVLDDTPTGDKS